MKRIYVGNLDALTSAEQVQALFAHYGDVTRAAIICDQNTGASRGFGYVLMRDDMKAENAIQRLNGAQFEGRALDIKEALPPNPAHRR